MRDGVDELNIFSGNAVSSTKMAKVKEAHFLKHLLRNKLLYILLLPGMLFFIIFNYLPMYGIVIAFMDFNVIKGIWGSQWVGISNFIELFSYSEFYNVLKNSLLINIYRLIWGFPAPIIVALMLNEIRRIRYKRVIQSLLYLPHFISWVVIAGIVYNFLSPSGGLVNVIIEMLGGKPVAFLQRPEYFRSIIVISDIWKEVGWGSIIYLAAMAGISSELYEASIIDGASRFQRILFVTIPGISTTIIVLFTLRMGSLLRNGFEQIFLLYNSLVYDVADVFETYTYRVGLMQGSYSFATAVGIFQSVIGLILILFTNKMAKKYGEGGLW